MGRRRTNKRCFHRASGRFRICTCLWPVAWYDEVRAAHCRLSTSACAFRQRTDHYRYDVGARSLIARSQGPLDAMTQLRTWDMNTRVVMFGRLLGGWCRPHPAGCFRRISHFDVVRTRNRWGSGREKEQVIADCFLHSFFHSITLISPCPCRLPDGTWQQSSVQ
jgi:hypothetical protein